IGATSELFGFTWGRGLSKVADPDPNATTYAKVIVTGAAITASGNDGNLPANTVDGNLGTRWSSSGDGQWITYDLGSNRKIGYIMLAVYQGDTRKNKFDLQVSTDNTNWTTVWSGASNGLTTAEVKYDFPDVTARYIRYLGHGY